jgi:hypothetical protein
MREREASRFSRIPKRHPSSSRRVCAPLGEILNRAIIGDERYQNRSIIFTALFVVLFTRMNFLLLCNNTYNVIKKYARECKHVLRYVLFCMR